MIFTLAIPLLLLNPDLFRTGFSFADLFGELLFGYTPPPEGSADANAAGNPGIYVAYVLAGLIPAIYILIDTARTRVLNPITMLAAASALIGGGLAFFRIDGWVFALKDSYASIVIALVTGVSLLIKKPFFEAFLKVALVPENDRHKALAARLFNDAYVRRTLLYATAVIFLEAVILGTANFLVNYRIVVASFGTEAFNAQVAQATAVMRLPSLIGTFIAYGFAFYLVQYGVSRSFGDKAKLFEDGFWEALEATEQEPQARLG
nr:VC0807 family protein [Deinobacterium chartae]